ncbi:hypothetical protein CLOSTASPAR_04734 [[Clostridium] asparagiforme DSM 15981]|uniref:Uncharacterized protein n=1 Tax=[Clostridium] asparagiforme DSM 15981 TaxID=518636 RepID=C0D639_9FIRM|nr:hypothetical protein CLOSTASPAR_04734 [[Clostridium] asparagiforme DSM 15981]
MGTNRSNIPMVIPPHVCLAQPPYLYGTKKFLQIQCPSGGTPLESAAFMR